jgi:DNA-binding transcriptional regulator GbsR (MarR family)
MKGYQREATEDASGPGNLRPWEALVVDAVGNVIDFWKFKRNQGRVWALLYLRGRSLSAAEIQDALGLSKGAVSMLVRELEQWNVVVRVRAPTEDVWRYAAETDLMKMVSHVISEREHLLVRSVREDLEAALRDAENDSVDEAVLARLRRMKTLADLVDRALRAFLQTARFDVGAAFDVFGGPGRPSRAERFTGGKTEPLQDLGESHTSASDARGRSRR